MHDPRRHRALAEITTIRAAERDAARHALLLANRCEHEAQEAGRRADDVALAAAATWQAHLATGGFHPELARALGSALLEKADRAREAQERAAAMTEERTASEADWQLGIARCRQADDAFAASRRGAARDREERALETLADRICYDWTRR